MVNLTFSIECRAIPSSSRVNSIAMLYCVGVQHRSIDWQIACQNLSRVEDQNTCQQCWTRRRMTYRLSEYNICQTRCRKVRLYSCQRDCQNRRQHISAKMSECILFGTILALADLEPAAGCRERSRSFGLRSTLTCSQKVMPPLRNVPSCRTFLTNHVKDQKQKGRVTKCWIEVTVMLVSLPM